MDKIIRLISKIYNEDLENLATRLLYFFNTINTYFILVVCVSFLIVFPGERNLVAVACALILGIVTAQLADFYPPFVFFSFPLLALINIVLGIPTELLVELILVNVGLFFLIQFGFMGIPDSIVARDPRVGFLKMFLLFCNFAIDSA